MHSSDNALVSTVCNMDMSLTSDGFEAGARAAGMSAEVGLTT